MPMVAKPSNPKDDAKLLEAHVQAVNKHLREEGMKERTPARIRKMAEVYLGDELRTFWDWDLGELRTWRAQNGRIVSQVYE